jgi:Tol biopolymer transport system component
MTDRMRADTDLAGWFADGPTTARRDVTDAAFARARAIRQRPAWQTGAWWTSGLPAVGRVAIDPVLARRVTVVAVVAALLLIGMFSVAIIGHRPATHPFPLAFSRADSVYMADADGTHVRLLFTPPAGFGFGDLRWSPDHSRVAIEIGDDSSDRLVIVDVSGRVMGQASFVGAIGFSWSPDGGRLAISDATTSGAFMLLDSAAQPVGSIPLPAGVEVGYPSWVGPFSWSPDGRRIAFPGCWDPCNRKAAGGLFQVDVDGAGFRQDTDGTAMDTWLASSSDGRLAAARICVGSTSPCDPGIIVIGIDGVATRAVGYDGSIGAWLSWAPDGARLAVVGGSADVLAGKPSTHLWVGRTDAPPVDVASAGFRSLGPLDWSADGRSVLFAGIATNAPDGSTWSIWSLDVDSGALVELVKDVGGFGADARP